ncbi:MAG: tripartite tricarboxylate transporter TctB family protein [Proteobacteria bacterium]|nr:tripartite tricarboxylate transporter TctB family protein [Pseudomonadota bacterium]
MSNGDTSARPSYKDKVNFNTVAAILFVALSILLFIFIPSQIDKPLILLGASQNNLAPELFPQMIAVALLILGIWFFFKSFSIDQKNELKDLDTEAIVNVAVTLIVMLAYVPLMVYLGFVVGSAIMIFVLSTYFGNRNYLAGVVISIVMPVIVFVIFARVLKTELPPFPIDIYPLTNWSII